MPCQGGTSTSIIIIIITQTTHHPPQTTANTSALIQVQSLSPENEALKPPFFLPVGEG